MPKILIHHRRPSAERTSSTNNRVVDCGTLVDVNGDGLMDIAVPTTDSEGNVIDYSDLPEENRPKCRDGYFDYVEGTLPIENEYVTGGNPDIGTANIYVVGNALYGTLLCTFEVVGGCGPWKFSLKNSSGLASKFFTLNKRLGRQFSGEECDPNHPNFDDDFFNNTDDIDNNALIVKGEQVEDRDPYYAKYPNPDKLEWEYAEHKTRFLLGDKYLGEFQTNWLTGLARAITTPVEAYYKKYGFDWPPPTEGESPQATGGNSANVLSSGAESMGQYFSKQPSRYAEVGKIYAPQLTEPNGGNHIVGIQAENAIGEVVEAKVNIKVTEVVVGKELSLLQGAEQSGGVKYIGGEDGGCKFPTITDTAGNIFGGLSVSETESKDPYEGQLGFLRPDRDPDTARDSTHPSGSYAGDIINDQTFYGPSYRHVVTNELIIGRTIVDFNSPEVRNYFSRSLLTADELRAAQQKGGLGLPSTNTTDKDAHLKSDFGWSDSGDIGSAIRLCMITKLRDPFLEKVERALNYEMIENTCRPVMTATLYFSVRRVTGTVILGETGNADFVDSVVITDGGRSGPPVKGYFPNATNIPVTFEAPSSETGETATGYAISNSKGVVTDVVIVNPGSEYITAPVITFASTANALTTAILGDGVTESEEGIIIATDEVASVTVEFGGFGYNEPFTNKPLLNIPVTFEASPTGDTATGHAISNSEGEIFEITITNTGSGYISAPLVAVDPPPPAVDALLEGKPIPSGVTQETDRCPCGPDICNTEVPDPCEDEEKKDPWE